ncbi:hypothetical protein BW723_06215 [Polaribacter reichenbachii]|uniref:LVIVD repeat-containing protein n=1 Tax=Polaribacter reichenbachii TaxID=996801 RepID=A0A1B8TYS6_9FLAO|nr:hypothetical protein [Polaribacter reichenbachii]APZ45914.1 hypothetical protein BW723_06215 [Polaribacter reichenbachii]AUC19776.1 hypothetical protein BTO17_14230 [Polaribacter reichenbachii]OBY64655.1 hypothetical protein LPB301_09505 [Polaribacter reichenbachii]
MKKLVLIILCFSLTSCNFGNWGDNTTTDPVWSRYNPITLTTAEFENSIEIQEGKVMIESSKIYIIGDYIFINDKRSGFHIFDNTDNSNPVKKKFLKAPGATDIAIRNNTLYINQATDLVVLNLDYTNFDIEIKKRLKNVFPELRSPDGEYFFEENKVVIKWVEK